MQAEEGSGEEEEDEGEEGMDPVQYEKAKSNKLSLTFQSIRGMMRVRLSPKFRDWIETLLMIWRGEQLKQRIKKCKMTRAHTGLRRKWNPSRLTQG